MENIFFSKLGAKKHEVSNNAFSSNKNQDVKISVRNNTDGRKRIAVIFDKNIILDKLKWKTQPEEKIKLDIYYKRDEGIGFIKNPHGQYTLYERKLKNSTIGSFELIINFKKQNIFKHDTDFSKLKNSISFHEDNNEKLIWISLI